MRPRRTVLRRRAVRDVALPGETGLLQMPELMRVAKI
jgi:hypothetical protein